MSGPVFFDSPAKLRAWFTRHAGSATELIVGFHKTFTGRAGLTWPQSVDEALCVGWIDGNRKRIDDERYQIRFSPRRVGSHWSLVNIRRVPELQALGRMKPAGLAAFEARRAEKSGRASHEQKGVVVEFDAPAAARFRRNRKAWAFFESTPPGYRRKATWIVISAKRPETRAKRLEQLIAACALGERLWD